MSSVSRRPMRFLDEGVALPPYDVDWQGSGVSLGSSGTRLVGTVPGGSGSSVTFEANSGLPVFNVKDATYGAVGDGSNDDTAEIQAAIDAASAATSYATVFLPFGTYKITSPLVITKPIRLLGEGCVVGDRLKNSNYAAKGAVIWNAGTTTDAIQFTPSVVSGLWPRGLGGMIFQDFGIDTPEIGGSAVASYTSSGWGPHSTGSGIAISGTAGHYGYYCQFRNVTVCRHYTGFNLNTNSGSDEYSTGSMDLSWCNALLCRTVGFDARSVEARLDHCRAKNNDPEWGPTVDARTAASFSGSNPVLANGTIGLETDVASLSTLLYKVGDGVTAYNSLSYATAGAGSFPANGTYGFRFGADGGWATSCVAITCEYGYHVSANGYTVLTGCGCDSSRYPYYFSGVTEPVQVSNCWGVQCYWEPRLGRYPYGTGVGFTGGLGTHLNNCVCKLGGTGLSATGGSVTGGYYINATVAGASLLSGANLNAVTRSSHTGRIIGCNLASITGSAGTSKGVGNIGVADW